jgi:hypothetical protein
VSRRRDEPEFFVGYLPEPPEASGFLRRAAAGLAALAALLAVALALAQRPLGSGEYEFGVDRTLEGALRLQPVPALWTVAEAGAGDAPVLRVVPLVGEGKHGIAAEVAALAGR